MNGTTENYGYNAASGNLETKAGGATLTYNAQVACAAGNRTIPHAVSSRGSAYTYGYDCNGNQTTRVLSGFVGSDTDTLIYDAENRLIEVKKNGVTLAQFTFDGDGRRVKSVVNGETILFVGGHYEYNQTTNQVTKYYFAGASRIAMRKYIIPQSQTLNYLLGDHLGSTSIVTDATGGLLMETRYKPWGEVRYTTPNMTLPTRYTYTGQYSYISDDATDLGSAGFGLLFYNARWYDPAIGRFAQADTIVPGGVQGLDRYAYVNNSPINYVDPSGHDAQLCDEACEAEYESPQYTLDNYAATFGITFVEDGKEWDMMDKVAAILAARAIAKKFGEVTGRYGVTVFREVYGPLTFKMVKSYVNDSRTYTDGACACGGPGEILFATFHQSGPYRSESTTMRMNRNLVVHELGHLYYRGAADNPALAGLSRGALIPNVSYPGGEVLDWQQHPPSMNENGEEIGTELFGDSFVAWVFDAWNPSSAEEVVLVVNAAQNAMNNIAQNAINGPVP